MSSRFSLIGSVSVNELYNEKLGALVATLAPQGDEIVTVLNGKLVVYIESFDVPDQYQEASIQALYDFCQACATEPALFKTDDGAVLVGSNDENLQEKHLAYLRHRAHGGDDHLPQVFAPEDTSTYVLVRYQD